MHIARSASMPPRPRAPVWIGGTPGTGRELFAHYIHGNSDRAGKPFVVIDCETLPEHMAETVLFGQDKGFHPGNSLHFVLGKLREADQGTLLIKEVSALKPELQSRLFSRAAVRYHHAGEKLPRASK